MGVPFALDYSAVMAIGSARGVDLTLLADVLPTAESAILIGREADPSEEEETHGQ
jgi:uncharacterized protein related to proFAR isomerase